MHKTEPHLNLDLSDVFKVSSLRVKMLLCMLSTLSMLGPLPGQINQEILHVQGIYL